MPRACTPDELTWEDKPKCCCKTELIRTPLRIWILYILATCSCTVQKSDDVLEIERNQTRGRLQVAVMSSVLGRLPPKTAIGGSALESFPPIKALVGKRVDEIRPILDVADGPYKNFPMTDHGTLLWGDVDKLSDDLAAEGGEVWSVLYNVHNYVNEQPLDILFIVIVEGKVAKVRSRALVGY